MRASFPTAMVPMVLPVFPPLVCLVLGRQLFRLAGFRRYPWNVNKKLLSKCQDNRWIVIYCILCSTSIFLVDTSCISGIIHYGQQRLIWLEISVLWGHAKFENVRENHYFVQAVNRIGRTLLAARKICSRIFSHSCRWTWQRFCSVPNTYSSGTHIVSLLRFYHFWDGSRDFF